MRVSLGLPTHRIDRGEEFVGKDAVTELARTAEAVGFDAVAVTDHPFPPDSWLAQGGHHTLDPLVTLAVAAAATTRLRLQTNLYVAAYRNPYLSAKTISTLDVLSGGRVILGIGAGYLDEEFAAVGADFDTRNVDTDLAILAMKKAWTGRSVDGNTMAPRPVQRPHPPIWVGGNSRRAIRRAVDHADGWVPMPVPARAAGRVRTAGIETAEDLRLCLAYAKEYGDSVGRMAKLEVAFIPAGLTMFARTVPPSSLIISDITALAAAGMTYAVVCLPGETRADLLKAIVDFGTTIIPRIAEL